MYNYKLNPRGYRVTKNGSLIRSFEKEAIKKDADLGNVIKVYGTYYFFNRKQGDTYVYLP